MFVISGASSHTRGVLFREDTHLQKPKGYTCQRHVHPIAAALDRPTFQRNHGSNGSQPRPNIIVNNKDVCELRVFTRSFDTQYTGNGARYLVEADAISPRPARAVDRYVDVDNTGSDFRQVFSRQAEAV